MVGDHHPGTGLRAGHRNGSADATTGTSDKGQSAGK
jgi:hypothetical protein